MDQIVEELQHSWNQKSFPESYELSKSKPKTSLNCEKIQPWGENTFQMLTQVTLKPRYVKQERKNYSKAKSNRTCPKASEREFVEMPNPENNPHKLKWTIQAEFISQRRKKFSTFLRQKHFGHYRSHTLYQQNEQKFQEKPKQQLSFRSIYDTLNSLNKKKNLAGKLSRKNQKQKKVVNSSKKKNKMIFCPAIIEIIDDSRKMKKSDRCQNNLTSKSVKVSKIKTTFKDQIFKKKGKIQAKALKTVQDLTISKCF